MFLPWESPHFLTEDLLKELYQQSIREAEKDVEQDILKSEIEPLVTLTLSFLDRKFRPVLLSASITREFQQHQTTPTL